MTPTPRKYRKKPVVIEAMCFDGTNVAEIIEWVNTYVPEDEDPAIWEETTTWEDEPYLFLVIQTLEGEMRAGPGDQVIRGVKGEFYPCKPDIFDATYEAV